jgi:hypothetical protein
LFQKWRQFFGQDDLGTLVVVGTSRQFNPTLPQELVDRELAKDPERARAEYLAEWRNDISAFIDRETLEAAVETGCYERGRLAGVAYLAFCDASGGRGDSFTVAIGYRDKDGRAILAAVREFRPPFSPDSVVAEIAVLLKSYSIHEVVGDNYAGEWPVERFRAHGITYKASDKVRTVVYLEFLPLLNSGRVSLLDHERTIVQFTQLERRTSRLGRDTIGHPDGFHDDLANAVAGVIVRVANNPLTVWHRLAAQDAARKQPDALPGYPRELAPAGTHWVLPRQVPFVHRDFQFTQPGWQVARADYVREIWQHQGNAAGRWLADLHPKEI